MPATARRKCQSGAPKRSPSRSAIGRAPIATMSRRIPPTPVAAPWNGSTADGWLCDSTLNATANPLPTSITPAFSPGPWRTRSPRDGSRFSSGAGGRGGGPGGGVPLGRAAQQAACMSDVVVRDAEDASRYEARIDGNLAGVLEYRRNPSGTLLLIHTEVLPEYEGHGVASTLV